MSRPEFLAGSLDAVEALSRIGTLVEIGETALLKPERFPQQASQRQDLHPEDLRLDAFYAN